MDDLEHLQSPQSTFLNLNQKKQERILNAAVDEFAGHGFKGASMNTLVRVAGISKGSIFQYFSNKKGLFLYAFGHVTNLVKGYLKNVRAETADEEVFERIRKSLLAGVAFVRRNPRIYNLYLRVVFESDIPFRSELLQSIRKLSIEYLAGLLKMGQERGEIDSHVDVYRAAFFLDSILDRFLQAYGMQHIDADLGLFQSSQQEAEEWADQVIEFCRHGLGKNLQ